MINNCISIIVPVYNAQAYVANCLMSIQAQTFVDWECICVDDGSSDESPSIVERFAAKDPRFHLIRQANSGPGMARNAGITAAQGKFFTFVDADDLLHPETMERLLGFAQNYSADLVVCDYFRFRSTEEFSGIIQSSASLTGIHVLHESPLLPLMVNWRKFRVHPVGKLYLRSLHGEMRFPHLFGAEDDYASFDVYARSNRAVFSEMRLYGYRVVEDGLTLSVSKYRNYIEGDSEVAMHCESVLAKHGVETAIRAVLVMRYVKRILHFLNEMSVDTRLTKREKKELMALASRGLNNIMRCVAGKYRISSIVHIVPYIALFMRALWLLISWQWMRSHVLSIFRNKRTLAPTETTT